MDEFVIAGVRVFDGEMVLDGPQDVVVADGVVRSVRPSGPPPGGTVVDGAGATLLPGLIDAHVHARRDDLRQAALFGVTTVLDMGGSTGADVDPLRAEAGERADQADLRSSLHGLTRADGHPHQLIGDLGNTTWPSPSTVEEIPAFVDDRVAEGSDYLKAWLEDGHTLGHPVPSLDPALLDALVVAGHERGRLVLVHALTRDATEQAVASGADGLTHLWVDRPHTDDLVARIAASGMHVVPTLTIAASLTGDRTGATLADEPRVRELLADPWRENLRRTWDTLGPEHLDDVLTTLAALHEAGVPVLAGSDSPAALVPGTAHGVSLHGELRLMVRAGLDPVAALRSATSVTAERFGLDDRGVVAPGRRADLVLVDGDPTLRIEDTLAIRTTWRGGVAVEGART